MKKNILILFATIYFPPIMAQTIESTLCRMTNQIIDRFELCAFDNDRYAAYPKDKTPNRYIPSMRIYFFADSVESDTSSFLSWEKLSRYWADAHIGGVWDPIYRKSKLDWSQAKDSLFLYLKILKNRNDNSRLIQNEIQGFLRCYLQPDAIIYPAFVYYSTVDAAGKPIEWNWCKLQATPYWQDGSGSRPVACLNSSTCWYLKDGEIYTGVLLDNQDSLILLGPQAYMDSLHVYPSFARYFNGIGENQCIPPYIRSGIVSSLFLRELASASQHRLTKREKRSLYDGLYFVMGFPTKDYPQIYVDYAFPSCVSAIPESASK